MQADEQAAARGHERILAVGNETFNAEGGRAGTSSAANKSGPQPSFFSGERTGGPDPSAARSGGVTLTPTGAEALRMLQAARDEGRDPHGVIANTMDAPYLADGQVFLSISTGHALERRGLIRIEDEGDAYLT